MGDRAEVYYVGVNTSTGALLAAVHAMHLPYGETINCMEHYGGLILLGTSKGFRLALIRDIWETAPESELPAER